MSLLLELTFALHITLDEAVEDPVGGLDVSQKGNLLLNAFVSVLAGLLVGTDRLFDMLAMSIKALVEL